MWTFYHAEGVAAMAKLNKFSSLDSRRTYGGRSAFSLHGGSSLPTRRVWVSYVEGLGFLRGVSGGAVGAGGFCGW